MGRLTDAGGGGQSIEKAPLYNSFQLYQSADDHL